MKIERLQPAKAAVVIALITIESLFNVFLLMYTVSGKALDRLR